jgi:two-component system OmpR family response regulator
MPRHDMTGRLLVVDDDANLTTLIRTVGSAQGFEVRVVNEAREFKAAYSEFIPGVIVLDLVMPEMDGFEVLNYLRSRLSEARIILLSGADATWLRMAGELGSLHGLKITGVLAKPFRVADLRRLLAEATAG